MTHTVLLIGLGGIGMLYDIKLPENKYTLSHARAFQLHPNFRLIGAVDPVISRCNQFSEKYKAPAASSVSQLFLDTDPDVVIIASPTSTHMTVIKEVLQVCRPKLILCEKPLAYSSEEANNIVKECRDKGIQLFVNYIRRADPGVIAIKHRIDSSEICVPFKAIIWYSKGLIHNGSHFLDLMTYWFGPALEIKTIDPGRKVGEYDAEPDCRIIFESGSAILCSAKEENFSHYTIEIIATNGRLRYEQGGVIEWRASCPHPTLDHYFQLQSTPEVIENDMNHYQYNVADQLCCALNDDTHILCTGDIGAMNIKLLESLINQHVKH